MSNTTEMREDMTTMKPKYYTRTAQCLHWIMAVNFYYCLADWVL